MAVTTEALATTDLEFARQLGQQLRVDSIRCSTAAGSGHPTSSMSASDLAEGSIWEAFDKAGFYGLANLTAILDINRLGQRGETEYGWSMDTYRRRIEAFGCFPIVIDGHDVTAIDRAYGNALSSTGKPTVILAKTIKGKGFSEIENKDGWHGKALPPDMAERAIKELGGIRHLKVQK